MGALLLVLACALAPPAAAQSVDPGCRGCHTGLEEMHPWQPLGCTDCHGGDGHATRADDAHVQPRVGWHKDERVPPLDFELEYARFRNPSDLRVVQDTCGACHRRLVEHLQLSLHGTTAGHLNDGLYENGVNPTREAVYGIFSVTDDDPRGPHALSELRAIERLRVPRKPQTMADHVSDLPRKACMQCHLWNQGVAVPGRLGQDGLYRGSGCATCHVPYAEDGRSASLDESIDHFEPGHPLEHRMVSAPPTQTCVSCHVGDASIGNGFRGLAQLYPQMPAGPDIPDTTDALSANQFFIRDPRRTPPDVHHAAGMHCVDCHTSRDVMGDGNIYGAMEHAVEIECVTCHGTPEAYTDLQTERGLELDNLQRKGDLFVLTSKVTGRVHRVKQAKDVVDPDHPDYNAAAALAMTGDHGNLECYACHSGWNTNFFGFHFDRNEEFTQLDLIEGDRTRGLVSTQERVFATLRHYTLGWNPEGKVAPYMVGFSTMGTAHARDGSIAMDQALPETAAGLSGMTMVHHQTHTVQPAARSCVECHRSPTTWGLGTGGATEGSFSLARGLVVVAGERGIETLMLDRENPEQSTFLARLPLGGARKVVLDSDAISGHASTAFATMESTGVALVDVRHPAFPELRAFAAAGDVRDVALRGDLLVIANGRFGLRLVDVSDRDHPKLLSDLATREARGVDVQWPNVYVADGAGGLLMVDVSAPTHPRVVGQVATTRRAGATDDANAVSTIFQYGRPDGPDARTPARMLAAVANGEHGLSLIDVTEPSAARILRTTADERSGAPVRAVDVTLSGRYELGDTTGVTPTIERDLAYVALNVAELRGVMLVIDVTNPREVELVGDASFPREVLIGGMSLARSFNPPQLVTRMLVGGPAGLSAVELTDSSDPVRLFDLLALSPLSDVAVEAFAFDRMLDETGAALKDISHEGARYMGLDEIAHVLAVPVDVGDDDDGQRREDVRKAFGDRTRPGGMLEASLPAMEAVNQPDGERQARLAAGFALVRDDPLARLVRWLHPPDFDANGDGGLSRGELEKLVFFALDANQDDRLDELEWPAHPQADPASLDRDRDGEVERSEMDLDDEVFAYFDLDDDGVVRPGEWPWEVVEEPMPVLMYSDAEHLRDIMKTVGFQRRRPKLYRLLAGTDQVRVRDIEEGRLEAIVERARGNPLQDAEGLDALGGFLVRWDLDGDGDVDADEYAPFAKIAARCDLNDDGEIDEDDVALARRD